MPSISPLMTIATVACAPLGQLSYPPREGGNMVGGHGLEPWTYGL